MTFLKTSIENKHIIHWKIHRPERLNSLGPTLMKDFRKALSFLKTQKKIRILVIHFEGNPIAIAGGDLKELVKLKKKSEGKKFANDVTDFCHELEKLSIPIITKFTGRVLGGGVEFILASDIRLATKNSALEFRQPMMGLPTGFGGTQRLVQLIGKAWTQYFLLSGKFIDAKNAQKLGLVHEVFENEKKLDHELKKLCEKISNFSPLAISLQKKMIVNASPKKYTTETKLFAEAWMNPLHRKKMERFTF